MKKKINVMCPVCNKFRRIRVPDNIYDYERGSLLYYEIQRNLVCDHIFTIVLDINLQVRDCIVPDQRKPLTEAEFNDLVAKFSK